MFNRLYRWAAEAAAGIPISSAHMDAECDGFAAGLSDCMTRDGQSVPTANIPMGGFRLTGLGAAQVPTDALSQGAGDGRYALLSGGLFTGGSTGPSFGTQGGGFGGCSIVRGAAGQMGYVAFQDNNSNQLGYIGATAYANPLYFSCANGFAFAGNITGSGTLAISGGITSGGYGVYTTNNLTASVLNNIYGYTPIGSVTSQMVINALNYTPANKAGDTFSGDIVRGGNNGGYNLALGLLNGNAMLQLNGNGTGFYYDFANNRIKARIAGVDVWSVDAVGNTFQLGNGNYSQGSV